MIEFHLEFLSLVKLFNVQLWWNSSSVSKVKQQGENDRVFV